MREKYQCFFIRGNKEDYWINRRKDINCDWKNGNHSVGAMIYCYENLTAKDIDFLKHYQYVKAFNLMMLRLFYYAMEHR